MPKIVERAMNGMKLCRYPEHLELLPVAQFNRNKQTADGYHDYCKKCRRKIRARWLADNKERVYQQSRERILRVYTAQPVMCKVRLRKSKRVINVVRTSQKAFHGWYEVKHKVYKARVLKEDC